MVPLANALLPLIGLGKLLSLLSVQNVMFGTMGVRTVLTLAIPRVPFAVIMMAVPGLSAETLTSGTDVFPLNAIGGGDSRL